jgi:mannose-6-phosphate isomerase
MFSKCNQAFILEPQYRDYVWGGSRLRPEIVPTAESWVIYEKDRIASGPLAGLTLAEASEKYGAELLGRRAVLRGTRFPLLIKLLDCADWLSLQVHPNDEQARRLEGPDQNGKTEAWHVVEADPGAALLAGLKPGVSADEASEAVRAGKLLDKMQRLEVKTGDSILIRAGMVHALGPGLMIYEVQQTSDLTYRVWDWDRPAAAGRALHIDKSLAVIDASITGSLVPPPVFEAQEGRQMLLRGEYFRLDLLTYQERVIWQATHGVSFHAITVLEGQLELSGPGWQLTLGKFESALVPATCPPYLITPKGGYKALLASV